MRFSERRADGAGAGGAPRPPRTERRGAHAMRSGRIVLVAVVLCGLFAAAVGAGYVLGQSAFRSTGSGVQAPEASPGGSPGGAPRQPAAHAPQARAGAAQSGPAAPQFLTGSAPAPPAASQAPLGAEPPAPPASAPQFLTGSAPPSS